MNRIGKILQKFAPLLVAVFGIVFVVVGIIGLQQQKTFTKTSAVIESIEIHPAAGEDDTTTYNVIVKYEVDGQELHSDLGTMQNGFAVGKTISILYDPNDPATVTTVGTTGPTIAIVAGGVCFLAGAFLSVRKFMIGR